MWNFAGSMMFSAGLMPFPSRYMPWIQIPFLLVKGILQQLALWSRALKMRSCSFAHYFADSTLRLYCQDATALLTPRMLQFLSAR
jgi:hypothetical protein